MKLDTDRASTTPSEPRGNTDASSKTEPLTSGWITLAVAIGVMAALIGLGGMILSFRSVRDEMTPAFGTHWAWLVPVVVDLTVFVFSGVDLVLARLDMSHPLARWTVYGATGGTVWLNYGAGGNLFGRVAHILMPSLWVAFVELMRHVVRTQVNLATASHREPIPTARWLLSPLPTFLLFRRMALWRTNSYTVALSQERSRLREIARLRKQHGWQWRFKTDPLTRLELSLGPNNITPPPASDTPVAPAPTATPGEPNGDTAMDATTDATSPRDTHATIPNDTPPPSVTPRVAPRHRTPRPAVASAGDTVTPLPLTDPAADAATLLGATPPEWQSLKKAEAMRRVDELLPGRTASQVVALLATCGVTVTPVDVRKTRQRTREAAATRPENQADDQEAEDAA